MNSEIGVTIESTMSELQWDELREYMELLDALFLKLRPDQVHTADEWTTKMRNTLTYFGLDLQDPNIAAAILFTIHLMSDQAEKIRFQHFTNDPRLEKFITTLATNMGLLAHDLLKDIDVGMGREGEV